MSTNGPVEQSPIKVYYLYSELDEALYRGLVSHLKNFEWTKRITSWQPGEILAGAIYTQERMRHLEQAQLILFLISSDFIASEEIYANDMQLALERHARGEAYVVPILLRPGYYKDTPFAHLKVLPSNGKPLSIWEDQDAAYTNIASGLDHILECLAQKRPVDFSGPTLAQPPVERREYTQEQSFCQRLLKNVYDFWIRGMLEQSLYNTAMLDLELREQPAAVANPWHFVVQEMKRPERVLSPGTRIISVYDEAGGELLILGEAGAGKTTLLLELTRALIERTEQDKEYPLPAVFNLSSWSEKHLPLSEWLVEELQAKYHISSNVAKQWIEKQQILPMLDGLDEVTPGAYPACIDALNTYHQENERVPLVVCCRIGTYQTHKACIALRSAVTIQPLTEQQINAYLSSSSTLAGLRTVLEQNVELRTLATTPLWLSILTRVFREQASASSLILETASQSLQHTILALYIESVQTRGGRSAFTRVETERWLAALAWQMQSHNQRSFYLERIQPDWLAKGWVRALYYCCMGCIGMVVLALALSLAFTLTGWQLWEWIFVLAGALLGGIGFAFASVKIRPVEVVTGALLRGRVFSLFFSVALCLFILFSAQMHGLLGSIVIIAIALSLLLLIVAELLKNRASAMAQASMLVLPDDGLRRSRRNGLWIGLLFGSGIGLIVMLLQLAGLFQEDLTIVLFSVIVTGLISGLIFGALAAIQLSIVRWLLRVTGAAPKKYVRFLDYAAERLLLYKIGAGYIFVHPLLQDYFVAVQRKRRVP